MTLHVIYSPCRERMLEAQKKHLPTFQAVPIATVRAGCARRSQMRQHNRPANVFVAGFIGSPKMNMLPVRVLSAGGEGVAVALPGGSSLVVPVEAGTNAANAELLLGIRPEHIRIADAGQFKGEAVLAERLGGLTILHADIGEKARLVVQTEGTDITPLHSPIAMQVDPSHCHLFAADGKALAPLGKARAA
ncbi:TOBE domain-containing protein [Mesorhizobium sp. B4-1-4]|uniref:TOBE domain-containing protein n=1 Tax=Mesorhizobium sp. B4-1-4 TaxID=2589888 RepID=UPI001128609E|nr:TOBE domain-containing protein [Mesorhizobium sp. B4-1-4]UCI32386.1 TOBE domain-containing protein [Mesorhizobium sp. B4-1-4]